MNETAIHELKSELELMLKDGNLGKYEYCKIEQIVLFSVTNTINYFTHIDFSSKYDKGESFKFLSDKPITIGDYKLAISSYTIPVHELVEIYCKAALTGQWRYDSRSVAIDDAFISEKKFVPSNDPTGGQYNMFVPLEYALYGSNYSGNYYIYEIYSKKSTLNNILDESQISKIQNEIEKSHLFYRLDKLHDRIGNVVCKFNVEILTSKVKKLGSHGIEYNFTLNAEKKTHTYCLHVLQEHDRIIYKNILDNDFALNNVFVEPNQSKTSISVVDTTTGLTLFYGCFDYRMFSNYYSQITPPTIIAQPSSNRILHIREHEEFVELSNIKKLGSVYSFCEMDNATIRHTKHNEEWFLKNGYMKTYISNQYEDAINDIVNIINNNLLWDLQEVWIIDPYLCADDIIKTVFKCQKDGIIIKALSSYGVIYKNKETKDLMNATDFEEYKKSQNEALSSVLGSETDIQLEYRTIRNGNGIPFHDRYIMLKYNINNDRVWSLGASVNSIGKTHSIIQIVESPGTILYLFDELWSQTSVENCIIFNNIVDGKINKKY